jgi:hypothetical protein
VSTSGHASKKTKSRIGTRALGGHFAPEVVKQFNLLRIQQDKTQQALLAEAINDLFAKYGLSRIAD